MSRTQVINRGTQTYWLLEAFVHTLISQDGTRFTLSKHKTWDKHRHGIPAGTWGSFHSFMSFSQVLFDIHPFLFFYWSSLKNIRNTKSALRFSFFIISISIIIIIYVMQHFRPRGLRAQDGKHYFYHSYNCIVTACLATIALSQDNIGTCTDISIVMKTSCM